MANRVALHAGAVAAMPFEQARTELCLGEKRARTELRATGQTIRRDADALPQLTPQEPQVVLLVGRVATNQEAASALFLSRKTIEYHLTNIYRKTNINSRAELANFSR
jgi:DNA-binding NarL/FixJ family response regulator